MKIFISQPMSCKTAEEIGKAREAATAFVLTDSSIDPQDIVIINSVVDCVPIKDVKIEPLWYLGRSIKFLAEADLAVFASGWEKARGCRIEHACAKEYGIDCKYMDEHTDPDYMVEEEDDTQVDQRRCKELLDDLKHTIENLALELDIET